LRGAGVCIALVLESNVKHSSFAIHLSHMSGRETSLPVQAALASLSARIDGVEHERLKVLAQLQALIVNRFDKYPGQLAVQRASIETRNKAVVSERKRARTFGEGFGSRVALAPTVMTVAFRLAKSRRASLTYASVCAVCSFCPPRNNIPVATPTTLRRRRTAIRRRSK
jgi:hypothetical protein